MSVDEALQRPGAVLWVETLPRKPRRGILSELAADFLFREECLEFLAFDMGERWDSVDVRVDVRVKGALVGSGSTGSSSINILVIYINT